jgi:hypothetical protein
MPSGTQCRRSTPSTRLSRKRLPRPRAGSAAGLAESKDALRICLNFVRELVRHHVREHGWREIEQIHGHRCNIMQVKMMKAKRHSHKIPSDVENIIQKDDFGIKGK